MGTSRCWRLLRAMLSTPLTVVNVARRRPEGPIWGQAVSYRFKRDAKGWRVFVTTETVDVPVVTDQKRGAIGVDLNADHLAVAESDASGNYVHAFSVPLVTYGKSRHQAEALIGDAVARVVEYARRVGKPIVIESIWTSARRKPSWKASPGNTAACCRASVTARHAGVFRVPRPPRRGGDSSGQPGFQLSHRSGEVHGEIWAQRTPGSSLGAGPQVAWLFRAHSAPLGSPQSAMAAYVAFRVPVRKRVKHVWTYWGAIWGQLRPALAAHHRLGKSRDGPNPIQAFVRASARGDSLGGDPFGDSGRDSRTESPCTVGAAARLHPRL